MSFSKDVKEKALIACKRYCVLCEKYKGVNIECHHIVPCEKGGDDNFENCIPLCFDCHAFVESYNPKHPKGNKYTENELKIRRDDFYKRISEGKILQPINPFVVYSADKKLYQNINNIFQQPNLQYYLEEYDLGNDFDNKVFYPLSNLMQYDNNPNYVFVDPELEEYKLNLFSKVQEFLYYKAVNTFPTDLGTQAIYTWKNHDYDDKDKLRINKEFNDLATAVWSAYKELIYICNKKLN